MSGPRCLIVNADDFGRSAGINAGVLHAHVKGIVTSASLMVRYPDAAGAAAAVLERPGLSVGLHLDLGEWRYLDGYWQPAYEVVPTGDRDAVARELDRQLDRFGELTGGPPTHIDSHQHVHRDEPVRGVVEAAGHRLGVPVRDMPPVRYLGAFYGQGRNGAAFPGAISALALAALVADLGEGVTELACHPAAAVDIDSDYGSERLVELESLCDPRVRRAIADYGVELCSFRDVDVAVA